LNFPLRIRKVDGGRNELAQRGIGEQGVVHDRHEGAEPVRVGVPDARVAEADVQPALATAQQLLERDLAQVGLGVQVGEDALGDCAPLFRVDEQRRARALQDGPVDEPFLGGGPGDRGDDGAAG
jgi:hypothetical protein